MYHLTGKLEVNILQPLGPDVHNLSSFIIQNNIPAVVASPLYLEAVLMERGRHFANYKVICTIDFPDGNKVWPNFAMAKLRDLPQAMFMADGYDIMLTPGRTDKECLNELRALSEFLQRLGPKELRWTLPLRTVHYEEVDKFLPHIMKWPASFVRTDSNLVVPDITLEDHLLDVEFIRSGVATKIKVCGNVNLNLIESLKNRVARFDVSLSQAREIIREFKENVRISEQLSQEVKEEEEVKEEKIEVADDEMS
jgi:hypothetical protein